MCNSNAQMTPPLQISLMLFDSLEGAGVRHCHWKSNQHLSDALTGATDIDLLVDKCESIACESVLTGLGFKRVHSQPWTRYPGIEDWLGFDEQTGSLVHVHLHYQLLSGRKFVKEQHLPWERLILDTAQRDPQFNIFITDPNLEIILLLIRVGLKTSTLALLGGFLGRKFLPKNIIAEFKYLYERVDFKEVYKYANDLLQYENGQMICSAIFDRSLERPATIWQIKKVIRRVLSKQKRYGKLKTQTLGLYHFLYFFRSKVQRKFGFFNQAGKRLHSGGKIITVIGCDGSGKSTISRELRQWLSWKIDTHELYLGTGDGSIGLPFKLLKFLASRNGRRRTKLQAVSSAKMQSIPKKSVIRDLGSGFLGLSIANERFRKTLKANRMRINGGLVITDRYPQNQFIGIYDGPRINGTNGHNSRVREFFARREQAKYQSMTELVPDFVVKLHVPVEVALSRKPDHNVDQIRSKAQITRQLQFSGAEIIDINAAKPLDDVIKSVKKGVWESL
ncbi:MAG: hypothetical protein R3293_02280 [Candidatus Promineifilaceae bacterium]|nr:hypothetical protein [Candidatus Promineifilaceae bacterium]